jgi:hypothetical protein
LFVVLSAIFLININNKTRYEQTESIYDDELLKTGIYTEPKYSSNNQDITDTGEFIKTDYSAGVYTRDVKEKTEKIEYLVHKLGGRVDILNFGEKEGRISFVIPKSNLSDLRYEIQDIFYSKLYSESLFSQNLLTQKQKIEQQIQDSEKTIF